MKTKKIYKIEVIFQIGQKDFNNLINKFDLGIKGLYQSIKATITTKTKPNKKMFIGYEKAMKKGCLNQGYDAINFKFYTLNKGKK